MEVYFKFKNDFSINFIIINRVFTQTGFLIGSLIEILKHYRIDIPDNLDWAMGMMIIIFNI